MNEQMNKQIKFFTMKMFPLIVMKQIMFCAHHEWLFNANGH